MKIFVTGATGFIGSHFLNLALSEGHQVSAVRRSGNSTTRIALVTDPQWINKPMAQISSKDLEGFDAIAHLAAEGVSPQVASWSDMIQTNVSDSIKLFQTAVEANVTRWVVAGTFAEYGAAGERYEFIPVNAPLEPTFGYAASKAAFFSLIQALALQNKTQLEYLRIFTAYGEGQHDSNFWPSLRKKALAGEDFEMTSGDQVRDFISVEAVAKHFLDSCSFPEISGTARIRNIGSGTPQTLRQFAEFWWKRWEANGELKFGAIPYRKGEVMRYVPEI